jgi:hypothetical protein
MADNKLQIKQGMTDFRIIGVKRTKFVDLI